MPLHIEDGHGGRRFVVECDGCGERLVAPTLQERENERKRLGWPLETCLCAACESEAIRRIASRTIAPPRAR